MTQFFLHASWWIPFYGLVGAILTLPWSLGLVRRTGSRPAAYLNLLMTVVALIHGSIVWSVVWSEPQTLMIHWLRAADLDLSFALELSPISVGATELVTGLSLLAQIFALGYMEKDWALARFFALMGFFEGAMGGLALSDSLFLSYALLEMLTLSTYFLVGFWYSQPLVVTAARDAFLTKRVGDVLLLMGVVALASTAGSLNFSDLYEWAKTADLAPWGATLLGLALIAGPTGKCAQFPLHLWLDEAMEGPNPASVLRNSVVVACGAYVLIRLEPIVALSSVAMTALIVLGAMTAIGASLVAIAQIDIKRALSHSTSAYLGLVFIAVGMGQTDIAFWLLGSHAIAKALLFMSTGAIIITTSTQDITEMGGLKSRMPATTSAYLVGAMSLVGLFPLAGFWSMDQWMARFWETSPWLLAVLLIVNGLTVFNLTRVFRLVFGGPPQPKTRRAPEVAWTMAFPLVTLTIFNCLEPVVLQQWQLLPSLSHLNGLEVGLLTLSTVVGWVAGTQVYLHRTWARPIGFWDKFFQDLLAYDFYIDRLYRISVVRAVSELSKLGSWTDRYVVDGAVNLVGLATLLSGQGLKYSIPGQFQFYALTIFIGVSLLGILLVWSL